MPLSDNLKLYYKCDESSWNGTSGEVIDSSDTGLNGTAQGGATTTSDGKLSRAGSFGSGKYVTMGDSSVVDSLTACTVNAWVKVSSGQLADPRGAMAKNLCFILGGGWEASKATFYVYSGYNWYGINSSVAIDDDAYHMVTGVMNSSGLKLYVDNVERASLSQTGLTLTANADSILLGAFTDLTWPKYVDEAAFLAEAWNTTKIGEAYNSGAGQDLLGSSPSSAVKTINTLARASVKTKNGLAIASIKKVNGLE